MNTIVNTPASAAQATAVKSTLPGFNVLLMGPAGTGKTHSIGTLVDAVAQAAGRASLLILFERTDLRPELGRDRRARRKGPSSRAGVRRPAPVRPATGG